MLALIRIPGLDCDTYFRLRHPYMVNADTDILGLGYLMYIYGSASIATAAAYS